MSEDAKIALSAAAFFALLIAALIWFKAEQCDARWSDYQHEWGLVSGCRVKIDGRWVPADRVREFAA